MAEIPKAEKTPIRLWWIIAEVAGSIAGVLGFINMLSGILPSILGFMTLPSFIFVPAVFALPIVINKTKLLFIPAVIL
jgi:hypothetical protein